MILKGKIWGEHYSFSPNPLSLRGIPPRLHPMMKPSHALILTVSHILMFHFCGCSLFHMCSECVFLR